MKENCVFCKILDGSLPSKKIWESVYVYAFLDVSPNSNGHTLIIPKKHFESYQDTPDLYLREIAVTKKIVAGLIKETLHPSGFNYISNEGAEAFQVVFHYHEQVIPKYVKEFGYVHTPNIAKDELIDLDIIQKKIRSNVE